MIKQFKHTHIHHIVPKHMGGTNHPDNLVELTIEEHADAHSLLYALHHNPYDQMAEQCLLGWLGSEEIRFRKSQIRGLSNKGRKHTPEALAKMRANNKGKYNRDITENTKRLLREHNLGKKHTDATKANMSIALKGINLGRVHTDESKANMSAGHANRTHTKDPEYRRRMSESLKAHHAKKRADKNK